MVFIPLFLSYFVFLRQPAAAEPASPVDVIVRFPVDTSHVSSGLGAGFLKLPQVQQLAVLQSHALKVSRLRILEIGDFRSLALALPASDLPTLSRLFGKDNIYPDLLLTPDLAESVPQVEADRVWGLIEDQSRQDNSAAVRVAVVDTGIDYTHPDLGGCFGPGCKVIGGYDFANRDTDPRDDLGHGTSVAGIIAANQTSRLSGVAPEADLLAYKVCSLAESGFPECLESDVIAGLQRAVLDGAQVINISLGRPGTIDCLLCEAVQAAVERGVLVVASAGNSGGYGGINVPGLCPGALAVGAVDKHDFLAPFSSRGIFADDPGLAKPELTAPGVTIQTPAFNDSDSGSPASYVLFSGTSAAAPHVSGVAALLLRLYPSLSPVDLRSLLVNSADDLPGENFASQGSGRLNALSAATQTLVTNSPVVAFGVLPQNAASRTLHLKNLSDNEVSYRSASLTYWIVSSGQPGGGSYAPNLAVLSPAEATLAAGQTLPVSLSLEIPTQAPSGYYEGILLLSLANGGEMRVPFTFWVDHGVTADPVGTWVPGSGFEIFLPLAQGR